MFVSFRSTWTLASLGFALASAPLGAQSETRPTIRVVGGLTAASLESSSTATDPLYGVALGAQYVIPARGNWYFVPELLLVDKGGAQTSGGSTIDADLRSLDLSVLARWSTGTTADHRRVFAFAGPTYGFLLSCEGGAGVGGVFVTGDCLDSINRSDVGLTIGGGLDFPSSSIDWGLSLRYQHGVADLLKASGEVRSRTVMLLLSYRI